MPKKPNGDRLKKEREKQEATKIAFYTLIFLITDCGRKGIPTTVNGELMVLKLREAVLKCLRDDKVAIADKTEGGKKRSVGVMAAEALRSSNGKWPQSFKEGVRELAGLYSGATKNADGVFFGIWFDLFTESAIIRSQSGNRVYFLDFAFSKAARKISDELPQDFHSACVELADALRQQLEEVN